jgi:hypothetical protein
MSRKFSTDMPVELELGNKNSQMQLVRKGAVFGQHCVLPPDLGKRRENALALTNAELMFITNDQLVAVCEKGYQHRYLDLRRNAAQSLRELMTLEVKEEEEEQEATDQMIAMTKKIREVQRQMKDAKKAKRKAETQRQEDGSGKGGGENEDAHTRAMAQKVVQVRHSHGNHQVHEKSVHLTVDVIKATGLASMDSSGLSDPYVRVVMDYVDNDDGLRAGVRTIGENAAAIGDGGNCSSEEDDEELMEAFHPELGEHIARCHTRYVCVRYTIAAVRIRGRW